MSHHSSTRAATYQQWTTLLVAVTVMALVQLIALLEPAESLIVTSVLAGDKKFKTVSFDSKFLPALKFEKPLLLPTEFRRHRTLRPPKFDIDVNIPIKLPMEEEYPQEEEYQDKKPIESNFFLQTGDVNDDVSYNNNNKKKPPQQYHSTHKMYASASNDYQQQQPVSDNQQQQQQLVDSNPKSIQDILQRPEDKASNKFSDGIDGAADSSKINSVGLKQQQSALNNLHQHRQQQHNLQNTNKDNSAGDYSNPAVSSSLMLPGPFSRSPDRRQQIMPSLLPLLNSLRSVHRARSLFQHHDQIDSRSSQDAYDSNADKMLTNAYATDSSSSGSLGGHQSGDLSGGQDSAIGYQPSANYQPSSSSSSYTSGDSNSPSPTSRYQHMGTQFYTRPDLMHHFQNKNAQTGWDSGQDPSTYTGLTDQQTFNINQDYLSSQMASDQNQQYASSGDQQQQMQQKQSGQYSQQQQQAALINAYIMQQQQQQQLSAGAKQQHQQQQQQQNLYMYPSQFTGSASSYSSNQQSQQQQDSQQPQSMSSELQPMVASSGPAEQGQSNLDNSQSSSGGGSNNNNNNDLQSSKSQQQQYDNQMASLQQAESQNDYQQQQKQSHYGNNNNQQYYQQQQEFVPGGFINLQLKGPEGGPKMTYSDYDRERWAQQVSQAPGAMPNHILNYQQLQNYYGGLGTFTNGLTDRYVSSMGILDKLKSGLHTLTSKLHLG